jgi:hypothetical protein
MITPYSNIISVTTLSNLLLDTYSGAAAAYSLRLLRSGYTGNAIRVRRASDNTEQNIGFVNNVLDTASLTSFCSGTNGFVTTWYDQSGNGRDATQSTGASQPKIYDSVGGVIEVNSKPAISITASPLTFLNINTLITLNTSFSVIKQIGFNSLNYLYFNASPQTGLFVGGSNAQNKIGIVDGTVKSSNITNDLVQKIIYSNFNDNYKIATNNNVEDDILLATTQVGINTIGRNLAVTALNGNVQELIIYPTDESANRTGINTNINSFYSIY